MKPRNLLVSNFSLLWLFPYPNVQTNSLGEWAVMLPSRFLDRMETAIRRIALLLGALILIIPVVAHAQPWSGILSPSRATDWSSAGVAGGIPNRTTICATLNPGASASQINNAISSCPSGQVVFLNAGTYNLTAGLTFGNKNNVTLRGAGADQTKLIFQGDHACTGARGAICNASDWINTITGSQHVADWTAGYAKGTTVITLSTTANMAVGNMFILDQLNDLTDDGFIRVCVGAGVCGVEGGGASGRTGRSQQQHVMVSGINGNQVTISPPIHMPNWRASQSPQAIWSNAAASLPSRIGNGIEDLSIDVSSVPNGTNGIVFLNTIDCWVKGVRILNTNRAQVWLYQTARATIRDSYFYGSVAAGSLSYGVEAFGTTGLLVENNISQHVTAPYNVNGSDVGSVYAYNFSVDNFRASPLTHMQATIHQHEAGQSMTLFEGNDGMGFISDNWHGSTHLTTLFRNHWYGDPAKSTNTGVMQFCGISRIFNAIGNVLGRTGYYTTYESAGDIGGGNLYIWTFGIACGGGGPTDANVKRTAMRWGNYDTVTATSRFLASEVPSELPQFANPLPTSQTLPASFYLTTKPAWFGSIPWPSIGPDVSSGQHTAGHAYKIPARLCYENTPQVNGILTFNASNCYNSGNNTALASPTNLRVVP